MTGQVQGKMGGTGLLEGIKGTQILLCRRLRQEAFLWAAGETLQQSLPNKSPKPDVSQVNSTKHLNELTPVFLKLFQKPEEEGMLPNSFYVANITRYQYRQRHHLKKKKKENCRSISLVIIDTQILNEILANWIQQYIKRIINHETWSIGLYTRHEGWFKFFNQCCTPH